MLATSGGHFANCHVPRRSRGQITRAIITSLLLLPAFCQHRHSLGFNEIFNGNSRNMQQAVRQASVLDPARQ